MSAIRLSMLPLLLPLLLSVGCAAEPPPAPAVPSPQVLRESVTHELDDFHAAAAAADETRYFAHFAPNGVFLGTDATERWDVAAFRAYAHARFAEGHGWKYIPVRRSVDLSSDGNTAWFDEDLQNETVGIARGSGVLVRVQGRWLVAQYNLTVPIPNEKMGNVLLTIRASSPPPAPVSLEATYKMAYNTATDQAVHGAFGEAAKTLLVVLPEAKTHPDDDTEFWLHNELTWLRWAEGHNDAALAEVEAAKATLDHGTLPEAKRTALRLHELWDRAYLLIEIAMAMPAASRGKALDAAHAARAAYDALAVPNHDSDGMAVLEAFFLTREGKGKAAAVASKKVDVDKDTDLQDLYVISRAFDASGDHAAAAAVRGRICSGHEYLMKPLIVAQLAHEGTACPGSSK